MDNVLGLPLDWKDMEGRKISPIHALVVLKGLDQDGYEVDTVMHTDGMALSNALGMARFAVLHVEDEVRKALDNSTATEFYAGKLVDDDTP
jgi:hypothetical protein